MAREYRCPGPTVEWVRSMALLLPEDLGEPTRTVTIAPPWGTSKPHDTDQLVPEYEQEFGADFHFALSTMRGAGVNGVWVYRWFTRYNLTKILPLRPGPNDWRAIRRHERAHCRGWGHFEGTPETNPCYNPVVRITGT